jgi:hypothetical protein
MTAAAKGNFQGGTVSSAGNGTGFPGQIEKKKAHCQTGLAVLKQF